MLLASSFLFFYNAISKSNPRKPSPSTAPMLCSYRSQLSGLASPLTLLLKPFSPHIRSALSFLLPVLFVLVHKRVVGQGKNWLQTGVCTDDPPGPEQIPECFHLHKTGFGEVGRAR